MGFKKLNDKPLDGKTLNQISIEFNISKKMFFGNDGCNQVFGSFSLSKDKIKFKNISSTMMMCENMEIPTLYIKLLEKSRFYKIEDLVLYLLDEDKTIILEFLKVD